MSGDGSAGWASTWEDILQGGSQRWKVNDPMAHQAVLSILQQRTTKKKEQGGGGFGSSSSGGNRVNILCPLSGDDPMVHLLWSQGHSVTAIDLVPAALERMRHQFGGGLQNKQQETDEGDSSLGTDDDGWTKEVQNREEGGTMIVWKHSSERMTQYEGDALQSLPELKDKFDLVYDKDSFGAIPKDLRRDFCQRIAEYTKTNAVVYVEVKLRDNHDESSKDVGPPFSLKKEDLMDERWYGGMFDYVEDLGSVYPIPHMAGTLQTGHILKRK